jgi:hypothetical protein
VIDGELWRSNAPPYDPRLNLTFSVGATDETFTIKGPRQCRQQPVKRPFWSDRFILGKTATTAQNHILIDDWTFNPRPGVYAEKVINSTCGPAAPLPGHMKSGDFVRQGAQYVRRPKGYGDGSGRNY